MILALAGILLWLGGFAAGRVGHPSLGVGLRWIGITLSVPVAAARSSLLAWTFLGMVAGAELGADAPHVALPAHFVGELFLRLVRTLVGPLIFATITNGVAAHGQLRSIGRVALKSLLYFEVVTTLGLILGALAMNVSGAGWGVSEAAMAGASPATRATATRQTGALPTPESIARELARNRILQVAVFSLLFGAALALLSEARRAPLLSLLQWLADTMFRLTRIIMYLAPLGAGAALAYTVGSMGLAMLVPLIKLVVTYYAALAVFCMFVLIPILVAFRIPIARFVAAVAEPAAIGFATTTSEAALPLAMERMEGFGVPRWIVSFVIPTGYSFNMDGSSVYLSMAAVFAAQAAGIHLSVAQQFAMLATLMIASKGIAGVPRAVLVILLATASAIHIPTTAVLLILGIDTLMDMGRTMMNVVGNCMASAVIARSEGALAIGMPETDR